MKKGVHEPTYRSWQMMKNRCLNPKTPDFKHYGAKGITITRKWLTYEGFLADMGERPEGMTLDRRDNSKNYCRSNCRWASRSTQARNRDYTLNIVHEGRTYKSWELAKKLKLKLSSLHIRLWKFRDGLITQEKLFTPNRRAKA